VFDDHVVQEYVSGTGQQGGPLVTSFNVSSRSDLRLYESDGNATMIKLAAQGTGFLNTCNNLLLRMTDTIPNWVIPSDVITPQTVKPVNATLDLDTSGNLIFSGNIRVFLSVSTIVSNMLLDPFCTGRPSTHDNHPQLRQVCIIDPQPQCWNRNFRLRHDIFLSIFGGAPRTTFV
jgi:hypothetical protein